MAELTGVRTPEEEAEAASALRACLDYMHVDEDEDGRIEHEFMPAAQEYLAESGITDENTPAHLYLLMFHSLTLHFYDHRDAVGAEAPLPTGLRLLINQRKHVNAGCF